MTRQRQPDDAMDALLRRGLQQSAAPGCPSTDVLAAYFERTLPGKEAPHWEMHFSQCAHCQEQLAALARMETEVEAPAPGERPAAGFSFLKWRWLAPALASLGAMALWVVIRGPETKPVATTASSQTTASQPVPLAEAVTDEAKVLESAKANVPARATAEKSTVVASTGAKPAVTAPKAEADAAVGGPLTKDAGKAAALASADKSDKMQLAEAREEPALRADADQKKKEALNVAALAPAKRPENAPAEAKLTAGVNPANEREAGQKPQQAGGERPQGAESAAPSGQQTEKQRTRFAQAPPQAAAGAVLEAQQQSVLGRTQEAPPKQAQEALRDTATSRALPRLQFAATVVQGRVEWRFYSDGKIERYDERLKSGDTMASPVKQELLAASAPSEKVCWAVGRRGVILRVVVGSPWKAVGSPTEENLVFIEARDGLQATVRTASGKVYSTTDGGQTWHSQ